MNTMRLRTKAQNVWIGCTLLAACGGDDAALPPELTDDSSGFSPTFTTGDTLDSTTGASATGGTGSPTGGETVDTTQGATSLTSSATTTVDTTIGVDSGFPGTDDGEPEPPIEGGETCDAGDEAFVKRLIPFVQGRRPESIREVRLLVSMIEQLDAAGQDGRMLVARGLTQGDVYLERWRTYLFEELRINLAGDRRNDECYNSLRSEHGDSPDLAAFIRDNTADATWTGGEFWMPDVVYSGIRLDDVTPIYRADLFARMSAPLIAGNVTAEELEVLRRVNYSGAYERVYLGRTTECLECHRAEQSVTWAPDEALNRHWPLPAGNLELAVYGPNAGEALATRHQSIHRVYNFATPYYLYVQNANTYPGNSRPAFGMGPECGGFRFAGVGPTYPGLTGAEYRPYMISDYTSLPDPLNATSFELDTLFQQGFEQLRTDGLQVSGESAVSGPQGAAYLFAMNFANRMWTEAMGFPLTVANNFPRNEAQRDTLHGLTEAFIADGFSLRSLVATVAAHEYFNQAAPAECSASTLYHLPAIFEPFSKSSADPAARGNGVGDSVHRRGAWPLLDSISQSMWWNKPDTFGEDNFGAAGGLTYEVPEFNCGGDTPMIPCVAEPADAQLLRDMGAFLSDSESGFEGIDMVALLRLEREFGQGNDPGLSGECTGPLGEACAGSDWIEQLVAVAMATPGALMYDVASAVKDRIITEPAIDDGAEQTALEALTGVSLDATVAATGADAAETAARRIAGMLFNTPQFMLEGIAAADQDPAADPVLVVPGTDTESLCQVLAPMVLGNGGFTCSATGVVVAP